MTIILSEASFVPFSRRKKASFFCYQQETESNNCLIKAYTCCWIGGPTTHCLKSSLLYNFSLDSSKKKKNLAYVAHPPPQPRCPVHLLALCASLDDFFICLWHWHLIWHFKSLMRTASNDIPRQKIGWDRTQNDLRQIAIHVIW